MRVLIAAENVSMAMGGEASLPFYYYKLFRDRGIEAFVACHARVREQIFKSIPQSQHQHFFFVEDTPSQRRLWKWGQVLPYRVKDLLLREALHVLTQRRLRRLARDMLVPQLGIDIVLEPSPITPKGASFMHGLGVPVAIGPLCGGMNFPPAFRSMDGAFTRVSISVARAVSFIVHRIVPGKRKADVLMVANPCTQKALPKGCRGKVYEVVESGVDLAVWKRSLPRPSGDGPVRFVYAGRFVDWKGVAYLVDAFSRIANSTNAQLDLVGDGELRPSLEALVTSRGIGDKVKFHGWQPREQSRQIVEQCDVFVLPSLRECGGTVLLEAMALEMPMIAADWGGPARYIDDTVGIRVKPASTEAFTQGLADAMLALATDPERRKRLGDAGPARARSCYYDWDSKADRVIEILKETIAGTHHS